MRAVSPWSERKSRVCSMYVMLEHMLLTNHERPGTSNQHATLLNDKSAFLFMLFAPGAIEHTMESTTRARRRNLSRRMTGVRTSLDTTLTISPYLHYPNQSAE